MIKRNKTAGLVLALWLIGLNFPISAFCNDLSPLTKANQKTITRHEIHVLCSPAKTIQDPTPSTDESQRKKMSKWVWIGGVGSLALGGLIYGLTQGGDDDNGDNSDTGNYSVNW
jgi:hypothetical protein